MVLAVKNYAIKDTRVSLSCQILLDFLLLFHKFCPWLGKLIFWSVGLIDPILSKSKKIILQNFGKLTFLNYYFVFLFLIKEIKQQTYINNQNQEAFIVIILNYKLQVFPLCLLCKILLSKIYGFSESNIIFILPTDPIVFYCLACRLKNWLGFTL